MEKKTKRKIGLILEHMEREWNSMSPWNMAVHRGGGISDAAEYGLASCTTSMAFLLTNQR